VYSVSKIPTEILTFLSRSFDLDFFVSLHRLRCPIIASFSFCGYSSWSVEQLYAREWFFCFLNRAFLLKIWVLGAQVHIIIRIEINSIISTRSLELDSSTLIRIFHYLCNKNIKYKRYRLSTLFTMIELQCYFSFKIKHTTHKILYQ